MILLYFSTMIIDRLAFRNLLDEGEVIVYVAHVHPFIIYSSLFKEFFLGLLIPLGGWLLLPPLWGFWLSWSALGLVAILYQIFSWYMDAWIVTNIAVINHEWTSPFNNSAVRIEFGTIETITSETKGFWGMLMRFGNLRIDNVSANPVIFQNVAMPKKVERIIMEHQSKFVHNKTIQDHGHLKDLLTNLLRSTQKKG